MATSVFGKTWDEATAPAVSRLVLEYEESFRSGRRPDLSDFLQVDSTRRSAELTALLRTDLALRWESGDRVGVEWYQDRFPDLDGEPLAALAYEEFCLREDAGSSGDQAEYYERFPSIASLLRKLFGIHELVGQARSRGRGAPAAGAAFPEVGETIAGFRLVEELGRGAFARVFRAEDRELADRPVALKVALSSSREPQTLARLQHTHIVPIFSHRIDPVTHLHLLCMPYLGRVTLARLLADPAVKNAATGADLAAILKKQEPFADTLGQRAPGHLELQTRSYARAASWCAARLAEGLEHAHVRGIAHRDIKPSNVLITNDGVPMLLDFNLAQDPWLDNVEADGAAQGGTLEYMSPEHLEGLAD
jgi:eukaryotic-like serine/threonine-protein kinase